MNAVRDAGVSARLSAVSNHDELGRQLSRSVEVRARRNPSHAPTPRGPVLARDLAGEFPVSEGKFKVDFRNHAHHKDPPSPGDPVKAPLLGLDAKIWFTPAAAAPDSTDIRLYQVVRLARLDTGTTVPFAGVLKGLNAMKTKAAEDVEAGWHLDHMVAWTEARAGKREAVSRYYGENHAAGFRAGARSGSNHRGVIVPASLHDQPGTLSSAHYFFETVAQSVATGHVYGALRWEFKVDVPRGLRYFNHRLSQQQARLQALTPADAEEREKAGANGAVQDTRASARDTASATAQAAVMWFEAHYRALSDAQAPRAAPVLPLAAPRQPLPPRPAAAAVPAAPLAGAGPAAAAVP